MALQLTTTSPSGADGNYWRVVEVNLQPKEKIAYFKACLFKSSTESGDGSTDLEQLSFRVEDTDYDTWFAATVLDDVDKDPQERAYEYIKTLSAPYDFTTASDV